MIDLLSISCRFCRYNDLQNSLEIEKIFKIVYCSIIHCRACAAIHLGPKHGFWTIWKLASQNQNFGLVTTLGIYIMSHSGQFHKLLFVPNTTRVRRYDIIYRIDVDSKYDRCTPYCRLGPRFCTISTANIDFDIMPQDSWNGPAKVQVPVEWS